MSLIKIKLVDEDGDVERVWASKLVGRTACIKNITCCNKFWYKDVVELSGDTAVRVLKRTMYQGAVRYESRIDDLFANIAVCLEGRGVEIEGFAPGRAGIAVPLTMTLSDAHAALTELRPLMGAAFYTAAMSSDQMDALTVVECPEVAWESREPQDGELFIGVKPFLKDPSSEQEGDAVIRQVLRPLLSYGASAWRNREDGRTAYWVSFSREQAAALSFEQFMQLFQSSGWPTLVVAACYGPHEGRSKEQITAESEQTESRLLSLEECKARMGALALKRKDKDTDATRDIAPVCPSMN